MNPNNQQPSSDQNALPQEPTAIPPEQSQPPSFTQPALTDQQPQDTANGSAATPPQQPAAPQPQYAAVTPVDHHTDVLGIWSIVLAFLAPLIGLILGIVGMNKAKKRGSPKTLSIIGTVLSAAFMLLAIPIILVVIMLSTSSLQQTAKDNERQIDIGALSAQLENYWLQQGVYPTIDQLNNESWRSENLPGLADDALIDPESTSSKLVSSPQSGSYAYIATGCMSTGCTSFRIVATPDRVSADPDKFEVTSYEQ